jgi:tetratricopeptide (TPR) repeat protein
MGMTPNTTAVALMDRGWAFRRDGKMVAARQTIAEAVALLRETGTHADLVKALGRLGHIAMDAGRWDEASALYEEGIALCRKAGDHGQVDRAVELWSATKKLYAAVGIQEGVDECAEHLVRLRGEAQHQ